MIFSKLVNKIPISTCRLIEDVWLVNHLPNSSPVWQKHTRSGWVETINNKFEYANWRRFGLQKVNTER